MLLQLLIILVEMKNSSMNRMVFRERRALFKLKQMQAV